MKGTPSPPSVGVVEPCSGLIESSKAGLKAYKDLPEPQFSEYIKPNKKHALERSPPVQVLLPSLTQFDLFEICFSASIPS